MLKANLHESLLTDDGLDQSEERSRVESDNFSVKSIFDVTGKRRISTIISDDSDDSSKSYKYFSLPPSRFLSLSKITLEILQLPILFAMPSRSRRYNFKFVLFSVISTSLEATNHQRVVRYRTDCQRYASKAV